MEPHSGVRWRDLRSALAVSMVIGFALYVSGVAHSQIPTQPGDKVIGNWHIREEKDPITDKVMIKVGAPGPVVSGRYGGIVIVRCAEHTPGTLQIIAATGTFLGIHGQNTTAVNTLYRLDNAAPVNGHWDYFDNEASAGGDAAVRLVGDMTRAHRIALRFERFDHTTVDLVADLTGADVVMQDMLTRCSAK